MTGCCKCCRVAFLVTGLNICLNAYSDWPANGRTLDQRWFNTEMRVVVTNAIGQVGESRAFSFFLPHYPQLQVECLEKMKDLFPAVMDAVEKSAGNLNNPAVKTAEPYFKIALAETPTMRRLAEWGKNQYGLNGDWRFLLEKFDYERPTSGNGRTSRVFYGVATGWMKSEDTLITKDVTLVPSQKDSQLFILNNGLKDDWIGLLENASHDVLYGVECKEAENWFEFRRCVNEKNLRLIEVGPGQSVEVRVKKSVFKGAWRLVVRAWITRSHLRRNQRMDAFTIRSMPRSQDGCDVESLTPEF